METIKVSETHQRTKGTNDKIEFQMILLVLAALLALINKGQSANYCSGADKGQANAVYGNALTDSLDCLSRDGTPYPR